MFVYMCVRFCISLSVCIPLAQNNPSRCYNILGIIRRKKILLTGINLDSTLNNVFHFLSITRRHSNGILANGEHRMNEKLHPGTCTIQEDHSWYLKGTKKKARTVISFKLTVWAECFIASRRRESRRLYFICIFLGKIKTANIITKLIPRNIFLHGSFPDVDKGLWLFSVQLK